MTDNELKISVEDRDLISVFMYGMTGLYSRTITWNDLMPVLEKINHLGVPNVSISIHQFKTSYVTENSTVIDYYHKQYGGSIGATYNAVISFLKWFNSQSKS